MPEIEATLLPESDLSIMFTQRECNWLQALEGDIDTSHFSLAACRVVQPEQVDPDNWLMYQVSNRAPDYHVTDTDWGTMYCAYRPVEDDKTYWRFAQFRASRSGPSSRRATSWIASIARAWVPMDDTHVMFVGLLLEAGLAHRRRWQAARRSRASTPAPDMQPNTTDWFGRWRPVQNAANDYLIDREAQRNDVIYTGITHIAMQDQAITESMGDIVDHSFEHLAPSDQMITRTRRRLLMAARALRDEAFGCPASSIPRVFYGSRGGFFFTQPRTDWRELYAEQLRVAVRPAEKQTGGGV